MSVVILTRQAAATLPATLGKLARQTVPVAEVVVVDNASRDGTAAIAAAAGAKLLHVADGEFDHGATRDAGVRAASGDVVLLLVGDAVPLGDDLVEHMVRHFDSPDVACVQGVERRGPDNHYWDGRAGGLWHTRDHRRWRRAFGYGASNVCAAYRRSVLLEHPFGPCAAGEDKAHQVLLRDRGWRGVVERRAAVRHVHRYGYAELQHRLDLLAGAMAGIGATYSPVDWALDTLMGAVVTALHLPSIAVRHAVARRRGRVLEWTEFALPVLQPAIVYRAHRRRRRAIT